MKQLTMTKVLTPLAALAFAFGVQAAVPNTETFESYTAGEGNVVISNQTGWTFAYGTDQADDASYVLEYSGDAPTGSKLPSGTSAGNKYLKLSTEDGTLFRSMDGTDDANPVTLNTGVFVDTDVQFTVTDSSDRPTPDGQDKFIVWLEADNSGNTNLCVWAREYSIEGPVGFSNSSNKVYTLGSANAIVPNAWYRLTVKAEPRVGGTLKFPAFKVYLDGVAQIANEYIVDNATDLVYDYDATFGSGVVSGRAYLPAMVETMTQLSKVGFSGEGALDSVVVTREAVAGEASTLTFTWSSAAITSVSLPTIGASITSSGDTFLVEKSSTPLQIVLNGTDLANYNLTINGVAYDPESTNTIVPDDSKEIVISATAKDTVNVTFELDETSWSEYWDDINTIYIGDADFGDGNSHSEDLKVGTNVTVSVVFGEGKAAAIELVPVDSPNISVNGSVVSVNSYSATATVKIVRRNSAATVDGRQFASFDAALAYAKAAGVAKQINLAGDVTLTSAAEIGATDNITIDLAGKTITGADNYAVFTVAEGGTLTITNSNPLAVGQVDADDGDACISNLGTVNLQAGKFSGAISGGTINVSGGYYSAGIAGANVLPSGYELRENTSPTYASYPYEVFPLIVISFNANGGTGTMADQAVNFETATALNANTFTYAGHSFASWNTVSGGTGVSYADGANISASADTTLYAQWTNNVYTVTVSGGANATATWTVDDAPAAEAPATLNYGQTYAVTFAPASGYKFADGATTTFSGTVTDNVAISAPDAVACVYYTAITFDKNTLDLTVGGTGTITPTLTPTVAADDSVTWESSDTSVATVANGTVTAVAVGTATITLTATHDSSVKATCTVNVTAAGGSDWSDTPAEIPADASAATQYPALSDSKLATANAKELTVWAKAKGVAFSDIAADTTGTYVDAFLLNCTKEQVATEKAAFKLDITVGADGTIEVKLPTDKEYNGTLQMKGKAALTDAEWTPVNAPSSSYKFYKYELSL